MIVLIHCRSLPQQPQKEERTGESNRSVELERGCTITMITRITSSSYAYLPLKFDE